VVYLYEVLDELSDPVYLRVTLSQCERDIRTGATKRAYSARDTPLRAVLLSRVTERCPHWAATHRTRQSKRRSNRLARRHARLERLARTSRRRRVSTTPFSRSWRQIA